MLKAIDQPEQIAGAQKRFLKRIRKGLSAKLPNVNVGYRGDRIEFPQISANNTIWFAHQSLKEVPIPRNWNAFGAGSPMLRGSNNITVEVNVALGEVGGRVKGLFAKDVETGNILLLHRGGIGGGRKGVGRTAFLEWCKRTKVGTKVTFSDPSRRDKVGTAFLVANLASKNFLAEIESFVVNVHRFKAVCSHGDMEKILDLELKQKAADAPDKPPSSTVATVVYRRSPYVAELAKRRAVGKCELCEMKAPFENASNEPYLESHHIVWLARGGNDSPENTVALCPNCHRKMHVVNNPEDVEKLQRCAKTHSVTD